MTTVAAGIATILERSRKELLDLSARNLLLNTPRHRRRSKTVEIIDELSSEIFRILVSENRAMAFLPVQEAETKDANSGEDDNAEIPYSLPQPEEDDLDERGIAARHSDAYLQTELDSEYLQKRLLGIHYDARTYEEEQGVNILYLSLGFLKWYESKSSDLERYAPLLLIPVSVSRDSALSRFKVRYLDEEISTNLSLQAKLNAEFGIDLPDVPEGDEIDVAKYMDTVGKTVASQTQWGIFPNDILLGFSRFRNF